MKKETPRIRQFDVIHPGIFLKESCIEPLNLSLTEAAHKIGIRVNYLSAIMKGRVGISMNVAFKLAKFFKTTPESWLEQQMNYDICQYKKNKRIKK